MKTIRITTAILMICYMLLANVSPALATPPQPSSFYGTVLVDGANPPAATTISARINGIQYGVDTLLTLSGGLMYYALNVVGDDGATPTIIEGGTDGQTVVFYIGPLLAAQTGVWTSGTNVPLNLTAVSNQPPVITEGASTAVTMSEDGSPTAFSLTLHATDADSATLTWSISGAATNGTATASGTGLSKVIGYTPTANYFGPDSFVVQVSDGSGGIDTITVNVTINAVNDPPVITEGATTSVTMSEDGSPTAFSLTLHATDGDSATLTWSISTPASHGTATASGTGLSMVIGYTPTANYFGPDSFVVQVSDGSSGTDTITVNVTIGSVLDAPVITEGDSISRTMSEDGSPTAFSLTLHATDGDAGTTFTWSISTPASHGTATASGTGASMVIGYTPTANYFGPDNFVVQVSDGSLTDTITVNVTIESVPDAPVITEGASTSVTMSEEGSPTAFSLTLHATDADSATLTWSISTPASHGTATASGTGLSMAIGYTPTANYFGPDSFVVQVSDGSLTDTITVNVTINNVNDPPVITEGTSTDVTMSEDGSPTAFSLTLHATDGDSATLTWSISTPASHGTATASGTGASMAIGYTPTANYFGPDSFVVQVSDGNGGTDTITVNVTIGSVPDAPVITEGASTSVSMSEDGSPIAFSLTLHATDADSATLTWSISTPASHGTATASGTGLSMVIGYTPTANYFGPDSFVVQVSDGSLTDTITVNVTINNVNDPPVITEGASVDVTMSEDGSPTAFSLTLHATDGDSATLTWSISTPASHGTATASGTGLTMAIGYIPTANYFGPDSFVVQVSDGSGGTDTITVNVTIESVSDAPVITEGASTSVTMSEEGSPTAFSLTLHATDADSATLTWSISTPASHGTATASGTGLSMVIGYTPTANYFGPDSFVVQVSDGSLTDTITVNVTINNVNDPPVITEGASTDVTMSEDGSPTAFSLTLHATDGDSATLTWSISTPASHGTATASGTGASMVIGYTPTANYFGPDSFVVQVSDGNGGTDTITVNVTIESVSDAPVITEGASTSVTMSEDGSPTAFSLTLHATDGDAGTTFTWSISTPASHGTATASGTGSSMVIGYTPTANYFGPDSFVVQVSDGSLTDTITVNVTINAVNDPPVITEGASTSITMSEDGSPTAFSLTLHATDGDSATLTWSISTPASNGTATASGTGLSMAIGYTPTANYFGPDSFVVQVSDGSGGTDTITVNVTIESVSDAPVITEGASTSVTMSEEGSPTAFSLTLHATDADSATLTWSISTPASHGTATASGTGLSMVIGYTPTANYFGPDSFVVQVSDGSLTDTITVNVTINNVNDPPVITEGSTVSVTMSMNGVPNPFALTLHATDVDITDTLTWSISSPASHGTATASGTGTSKDIGYTPNLNYTGTDSFVVRVADGNGGTDTITVNVTISLVTHTISGTVGVAGASVAFTGGSPVTSGVGGAYSITVPYNWSGTVTPTLIGYTFVPTSRSYTNVQVDQTNQNYTPTQIEYTLTIVSAHGTVTKSPNQATYHYGDLVQLTASPALGYTFVGWSGSISGTANPITLTITGNMSVTANYTQDEYTLTVISAHGTVTRVPNQVTYHYGDTVQLTAAADPGWTFANWSGGATGTANPVSVTITANTTVTANYTQNEYTLTVVSAHGTVAKDPNQSTYHYGDVVQLTATPDPGWLLTSWTGGVTGTTNPISVTIQGNTTVTANYTQAQYTLTVISAQGTVTKNPDQVTYLYGDTVQLTAAADLGWTFASWSGGATGTANPVSVTITANTTVTANYTQNEYTLTVISAHGTVAKDPNQATYHYGDVVQLTATPDLGWNFASWSGDATGSVNPVSVTIIGNMSVTANYTQGQYTLTIVSEHGNVVKAPDQAFYTYGDEVVLTATAAPGWTFANWSGAATGTLNPVTITITGDTTVTANYTQDEYTLTVISEHGTVTLLPDQPTYHYGDIVEVTVAPESGWYFLGWSGDATGLANPLSLTISGDMTITANYGQFLMFMPIITR